MTVRLGVVMDPISTLLYDFDSTLAMLFEAQKRNWEIHYFEQIDLFVRDGVPFGRSHRLKIYQDMSDWYELYDPTILELAKLDVILMRKDPPFNDQYIYTTYLLELAEKLGVSVINRPQALRDANEKFFVTQFPQCAPPTLVTQSVERLKEFWHEHDDIVCKPLYGMGGASVFHLKKNDANAQAIFDLLTHHNSLYMMAQKFIPEIAAGDKRIILINGKAVPYALARIPQGDDWRGNMAVGAKPSVQPLSARDQWICDEVGPVLREKGLYFVGIDVIGDYLTEINSTSPTGIRELEASAHINVSEMFLDEVEALIKRR